MDLSEQPLSMLLSVPIPPLLGPPAYVWPWRAFYSSTVIGSSLIMNWGSAGSL